MNSCRRLDNLLHEKSVTEKDLPLQNIESTLCLISGTSACHMILNKKKMMIPGIWGPYFSAILGDYWLHEGLEFRSEGGGIQ